MNFIFEKINHDDLKRDIEEYQIELDWNQIYPNYIWDNDCYLYRIVDETGAVIAFLYYERQKDGIQIDKFEVVKDKRSKGYGTEIINQFFSENKINPSKVDITPVDSVSEKFWTKLGVECEFYG